MPSKLFAALAMITSLTSIQFSNIAPAADILVIGDSMGVLIDNAITTVAGVEGERRKLASANLP